MFLYRSQIAACKFNNRFLKELLNLALLHPIKPKGIAMILQLAEETFLKANDLSMHDLESVLSSLLRHRLDYADLFFQRVYSESWLLEDHIIKSTNLSIEEGVGVRAVMQEKTGFAYSEDIHLSALRKAARAAKTIARRGGSAKITPSVSMSAMPRLYEPLNPLMTLSEQEKVELLHRVDAAARAQDPRVTQVIANLSGMYEIVLVRASDGVYAADVRPLVRLNVSVVVEDKGAREKGYFGGGQRSGYEFFLQNHLVTDYAKAAVDEALINLSAVDAPAGLKPVVLGAGWPAVLLHEAVGHGLEGDFIRKKTSAFADKFGQRVASSVCTIVDDGTLSLRRGSLSIDDEGTPTQKTVLIENGILTGCMLDKQNAQLMKQVSTGNGRRESYAHLPIPRMTNTYLLPGEYSAEEIIGSIQDGIYIENMAGGQVDITSGKFVFSTSKAYLIEHGKITAPIKDATLIGNGPEALMKISMVGNQLQFDAGVGICGKDGQSVPVGVGQPMIKIDEMTVGGTRS